MMIETNCGLVETKDLLHIRKPYESNIYGWVIELRYNGKKEDISLYANNQDEATECYKSLTKTIIEMQKPASVTQEIPEIRLTRGY